MRDPSRLTKAEHDFLYGTPEGISYVDFSKPRNNGDTLTVNQKEWTRMYPIPEGLSNGEKVTIVGFDSGNFTVRAADGKEYRISQVIVQ